MIEKQKIYEVFILLPYVWLVSGLLMYKSGDKMMVFIILISVITSLLLYGKSVFKNNVINQKTLYILIGIAFYALFYYFYQGISSRELRGLFASAVLLSFFPSQLLTRKHLIFLALIGSITTFCYTMYFTHIVPTSRAQWSINAIPYATLTAAISVLAFSYLLSSPKKYEAYISLLILSISTYSLIQNQTRGVLVAFLVIAIYYFFKKVSSLKSNSLRIKISLAIISVVLILGFLLKPMLENRIEQTKNEITQIENKNFNTSIGLRLQMWALTPDMVKGNLMLGLGNGHSKRLDELHQKGLMSPELYRFHPKDYHNQYLNWLIKHGLIGLILTTCLILFPLFQTKGMPPLQAKITKGMVILFATASLFDVSLHQAQTIFMFCMLSYLSPPREQVPKVTKTHLFN